MSGVPQFVAQFVVDIAQVGRGHGSAPVMTYRFSCYAPDCQSISHAPILDQAPTMIRQICDSPHRLGLPRAWWSLGLRVVGRSYSKRGCMRGSRLHPPYRSRPRSSQARNTVSSWLSKGRVLTDATHWKAPRAM
jgi:hypothetical protein